MSKFTLGSLLLTLVLWVSSLQAATLQLAGGHHKDDVTIKAIQDKSGLSGSQQINVKFHVDEMNTEIKDTNVPLSADFSVLKFKTLSLTSETGKPGVPFQSILVMGKPSNIKVSVNKGKSVNLENIIPSPVAKMPFRCGTSSREEFVVDWNVFNKGNDNKLYNVELLGDFRGIPISRITFYPMQFNGMNKGSIFYPEIAYSISAVRSSFASAENDENNLTEINDTDVSLIKEWSDVLAQASLNNRMLIMTPKQFVGALSEFVEWKRQTGYQVDVVTLESLPGMTYNDVRSYIQARYKDETTRFTYALLVGEEKLFPTDFRKTSSSRQTPSDLGYFTFGGDADYIPDVFYGRFVVNTDADIKNQVAKIKEYEQVTYSNPAGLGKGIGIASNEGSNPSDVDYIKEMDGYLTTAFGTQFSHFFQADPTVSSAINIRNALSAGAMWLNYLGHGSGTSWPSIAGGEFGKNLIPTIAADTVKPVIIDVACANGKFTAGKFGERFMNEMNSGKPNGAVAYYGGSVNISWHPPAIMARGIAKTMKETGFDTLGEALIAGQMYLFQNFSDKNAVKDNLTWYHLFGDPTLYLRTKMVQNLVVTKDFGRLLVQDEKGIAITKAKVVVVARDRAAAPAVFYTNNEGLIENNDIDFQNTSFNIFAHGYKYYHQ